MATQAQRTARMRARLLRATVRCLLSLGYTRTSTTEICRRAKVSRGAQLHHFPTKAALVAAAVEQVFLDRMKEFEALLLRLGDTGPPAPTALFEHLWPVYTGEAFYAWLELVVAARTDAGLRAHVKAVDGRFTRRAEALCAAAVGTRLPSAREVGSVTRLVLSVFDGLATHRILSEDDRASRDVLALLSHLASVQLTKAR
jgi:AcrR family transcriptional regulator